MKRMTILKLGNSPLVVNLTRSEINISEILERYKVAHTFWKTSINSRRLQNELCLSSWSTSVRAKFIVLWKTVVSLGFQPQRKIKGSGFFICGILLPTQEDYIKATSRDLITKDLILTGCDVRRRSKIVMFEIPPQFIEEYLPVAVRTNTGYPLLYPEPEWRFGIMFDQKPSSHPTYLNVAGLKPVENQRFESVEVLSFSCS